MVNARTRGGGASAGAERCDRGDAGYCGVITSSFIPPGYAYEVKLV